MRLNDGGGSVGIKTTLTTTTALIQTIDTIPIPTDKALKISIDVSAKRDDLTEKGGFVKEAIFANNNGTISRQGAVVTLFDEAPADWVVSFLIDGINVLIKVITGATINVDWKCLRVTLEV